MVWGGGHVHELRDECTDPKTMSCDGEVDRKKGAVNKMAIEGDCASKYFISDSSRMF